MHGNLEGFVCHKKYEIFMVYFADIDECVESVENVCDSNQNCQNTMGSYRCVCKSGFQLDTMLQACVGKYFYLG